MGDLFKIGNLNMLNIEVVEWCNIVIVCGVGMQIQVYVVKVKNFEVWDVEGICYIDFVVGIVVVNIGYCYFKIVEVVNIQFGNFIYICYQVLLYENYIYLVECLNDVMLGDFEKCIVFVIIGVEVVENVIKVVCVYMGCLVVIVFGGVFYGWIFMGMLLIGKVVLYKVGFGVMMFDVYYVFFFIDLYGIIIE